MSAVGIGNRMPVAATPEGGAAPALDERAPILADCALVCIATWCHGDGSPVHPTTGAIAARLGILPETIDRSNLDAALHSLAKRSLVRYEHDPATGDVHWRVVRDGWTVIAERLGFRQSPLPPGKPKWRRASGATPDPATSAQSTRLRARCASARLSVPERP